MTRDEFWFWIKGFVELSDDKFLLLEHIRIIRNHAKLVEIIARQKNLEISEFVAALEEGARDSGKLSIHLMKKLAFKIFAEHDSIS